MKKGISVLISICVLSMFSCHNGVGVLSPSNYVRFLENSDNALVRKIKTGGVEYCIQLATPEYMTIREFSRQIHDLDTTAFNTRLQELKGYIFFLIKIKDADPSKGVSENLIKKSDAERMVMYYYSSAADDISLVDASGIAQKPLTYLFENNYSLVTYNTIVAGFGASENQDDIELIFNDRYNGNPYIKAKYSSSDLAKIPGLAIK